MTPASNLSDRAPSVRASDADRERVADALRRHHLDGRLDTDELQERLDRCYAAPTHRAPAPPLPRLPPGAPAPRPADLPAGGAPRSTPRRFAVLPVLPVFAVALVVLLVLATVGAV